MMGLHILTIGHSNHALGTFLWLLQRHDIEALVDVRPYKLSRWAVDEWEEPAVVSSRLAARLLSVLALLEVEKAVREAS